MVHQAGKIVSYLKLMLVLAVFILVLPAKSQQQSYTNLQEYGASSQNPDYDYGTNSNSGLPQYGAVASASDYSSPTGPVITQPSTGSQGPAQPTSDLPPPTTPASHIPGGVDFSEAVLTEDGRLCVIKDSTVTTLSKDPILECKHKNVEKCHYTYVTVFNPQQEEQCEENFEKSCQITFRPEATRETVRKCYRPQRKVCNGQGPQQCRTEYESSCTTRWVEESVRLIPNFQVHRAEPWQVCGGHHL